MFYSIRHFCHSCSFFSTNRRKINPGSDLSGEMTIMPKKILFLNQSVLCVKFDTVFRGELDENNSPAGCRDIFASGAIER